LYLSHGVWTPDLDPVRLAIPYVFFLCVRVCCVLPLVPCVMVENLKSE
jgi:hypothetical protein